MFWSDTHISKAHREGEEGVLSICDDVRKVDHFSIPTSIFYHILHVDRWLADNSCG